tara:strand:+ start:132 stop:461 length:330 start_codon:yes stop_codon:yes gene_type:complete
MKPYFIVYTQDGCKFCKKAVGLLKKRSEPFITTDLTNCGDLLGEVQTVFQHDTIPIVLRADQENAELNLVGGYTELEGYFESLDLGDTAPEPDSTEEDLDTRTGTDEEE